MAVDMFLKLDAIEGESRDKAKAKEIDILAWSWGLSNSGTSHGGGGSGAGKANFQDISVTKYVDCSSHALIQACAKGTHIKNGTLTVRKAGGTPMEYIVIVIEQILVTSVSTGGSGGEDRLTENVTLNFAKVTFKYQQQKADGSKEGGMKEFTYDIAQNTE